MAIKPSVAQRVVLARLAEGERLEWNAGLGRFMDPYYSFGDYGKHVHGTTAHALRERGWIRRAKGGDLRTTYYELTAEGRAALDADGPRGEAVAR